MGLILACKVRLYSQLTSQISKFLLSGILSPMPFDPIRFTRQLVDIDSVTGNEIACGEVLQSELAALGMKVTRVPVKDGRFSVLATFPENPQPSVYFSTHFDTVPPFITSSEDADNIYGRGSCDAKGIIAAMIAAALRLHRQKENVGLLFLAGEEQGSDGAKIANAQAQELHGGKCKYLINGEPTESKIAIASKGTLRAVITASGKMAHSAYPHLGESAIEKLVQALERLRTMPLPSDPEIGACTMNIGMISGGRAPNVIPDHAEAQLLYRLVGPSAELKKNVVKAVGELAKVNFYLEIPFMRFATMEGIPTMIAAFTTDIPALTNWGKPLLFGPGSIHVAHTDHEFIAKKELLAAVEIYVSLAESL
jgi:acetylornithine deacetylase